MSRAGAIWGRNRTGVPTGTTSRLTPATPALGQMNSLFQSRETTSMLSGAVAEPIGCGGSRSCAPIYAMPPRETITSAGIDQTIISIRPEYSQSGR